MRYYESLYIVNPNYEQERLDEVMKTVFDKIGEYGFSMINHHVWGKKRLAYAIQKHKYGSFILLHFETESVENLDRFQRFMVLEKPILRNQTVVLEARPEVQVVEEIVDESEEAVVSDTGSDNSEEKKPKEEVVETTAIETEEPSEEIAEEATIEEEPVEKETSEDTEVKDEVEEKVEIQE
ncbi:MAG: 30S ribosomal protein S6 [Candidatus Marinimicrobia bacterium]|nr:30S ribosomal protein S6 [Candidatus Neomarinimicrobiota bacterium]